MTRRPRSPRPTRIAIITVGALALGGSQHARSSTTDLETCPETSDPKTWSGELLGTSTHKDGVVYDAQGQGLLRLDKTGGTFSSTTLGITDLTVFAAAADFNLDGWDDFVGAGEATAFVRVYRNRSKDNLADYDGNALNGLQPMNFDDVSMTLRPKFSMARELNPATASHKWRPIAAADFDGNGRPDVFRATAEPHYQPSSATIWLNTGNDSNGDPVFGTGYSAMASGTTPEQMGVQTWGGTSIVATDYNGDRKIDLLVGSGESGGSIRIFQNTCTLKSPLGNTQPAPAPLPCATNSKPTFKYVGDLISGLGFGSGQGSLPAFAFTDLDGDGKRDLVVGAPICCTAATTRLRIWKGVSGGGIESSPSQSVSFPGAATAVLAADFSLDGRTDLIIGSDNWNYAYDTLGGQSVYYANNRTATPFSDGITRTLTSHSPTMIDFDVGFVFNYDNDPTGTPDIMIADGNHSASFYVFANRVMDKFVACGEVISHVLDLGELESEELVITGARIKPTGTLNNGRTTLYLSNEEPANWVPTTDCGGGYQCASFPKPTGRDLRWKAVMCSNNFNSQSPVINKLTLDFDFVRATEHYRAGVIVADGVTYAGGFRQPGARGLLYATNAGLSETYWEGGAKLDAMNDADRKIYTSDPGGTTRVEFRWDAASNTMLQQTLKTTDSTQTVALIDWVRSKRFGISSLTNTTLVKSRLGAVETSTPAIIMQPGPPLWYSFATTEDRALADQFMSKHSARKPLVVFGSKDGMIHALRNDTTRITASSNGTEAWAYIPSKIAGSMLADYTTSLSGSLAVTAYPDGSPTISDVKIDGEIRTVALVSGGNGSQSVVALDVTETVDLVTGAVTGPQPLWNVIPGEGAAGQAFAKPIVTRVLIDDEERYISVAATGLAYDNTEAPYLKGRVVAAYDIATGETLWQFRAKCPITSDISTFETDDSLEPGAPTVNGYSDRLVFADKCGYVYKVNPGKDLGGGWNDNSGLGTKLVETIDGKKQYALFSTQLTTGALGAESPITGTIAARVDDTTRMVLFFGTGGLESHPSNLPNAFYAVYADDGSIRSKLAGACVNNVCEKFYGGVVVTPTSVIMTRATDPILGTGTCDRGTSKLQVLDVNAEDDGDFTSEYVHSVSAAVMGSLYGDANALYFATLSGEIVRVGTPRAETAGGDTTSGYLGTTHFDDGEGGGAGDQIGTSEPMALLGWRQVF